MLITARHALVTGSSRGIGRGIALKLAEQGVRVAINYLKDEASANATLEGVRARGADGFTVQADVCQPKEIQRMFKRVRDEFGSLDVFVANARTDVGTFYEPAMAISLDKWDTAMTRRKAFLVGVREAESDVGRRTDRRYHVCTGWALWQLQSWVAMGAAKSALETLARYFAVALAPRGITVNAISPGWIEDSVLNTLPEPVVDMIREHHRNGWTPMRRLGTPADIGDAVTLLCTNEARWITGQLIAVDGGMSLMDPPPVGIQQPELQTRSQKARLEIRSGFGFVRGNSREVSEARIHRCSS